MAANRKVVLKGPGGIRNEYDAGGAITPGHLVRVTVSNTVVVHDVAGERAAPTFAVEEDFLGTDIDNAYAAGELVQTETLPAGSQVNAFVAASAESVEIGDMLESAGDGTLRNVQPGGSPVGDDTGVIARALEAVTSPAALTRIAVEIV